MKTEEVDRPFMTSTLEGGKWSVLHCRLFASEETAPSTHWKEDWVGLRAGLDAVE